MVHKVVGAAGTGEDVENNIGVATGKTVIISRQTHNLDKNFEIVNIWIELDGKAITPEFSNGQYYFTVPYVDSKLAEDLEIFVQYAKDSEDSFNLVAINATAKEMPMCWAIFSVTGILYLKLVPRSNWNRSVSQFQ